MTQGHEGHEVREVEGATQDPHQLTHTKLCQCMCQGGSNIFRSPSQSTIGNQIKSTDYLILTRADYFAQ